MKTKKKILLATLGLLVAIAPQPTLGKPRGLPVGPLQVPMQASQQMRPASPNTVPYDVFKECGDSVALIIATLKRCKGQGHKHAARGSHGAILAELEQVRPTFEAGLASVLRNLFQWGNTVKANERIERVEYLRSMIEFVEDDQIKGGLLAMLEAAQRGWQIASNSGTPRRMSTPRLRLSLPPPPQTPPSPQTPQTPPSPGPVVTAQSPRLSQVCAMEVRTSPRVPNGPLRGGSQESFGTLSSSPGSVGSR